MELGLQAVPEEGWERGEGEAGDHGCYSRKSFLSSLILGEANCCFLMIVTPSSSPAHKGPVLSQQSGLERPV